MHCTFKKYILQFKSPAGTSRGWLHQKETYFLIAEKDGKRAYGECNLFKGLSWDDRPGYESKLAEVCNLLSRQEASFSSLRDWPSIAFGVETLLRDMQYGFQQIIFPEAFSESTFTVPINGLVWMGSREEMMQRADEKLSQGFDCIKLKIGGIRFEDEVFILEYLRSKAGKEKLVIRLDANGSFTPEEALKKIDILSAFDIQYLEQPVKAGQWDVMRDIIKGSPVPIALDEELIGITSAEDKKNLIDTLRPDVLILKPALLGGFSACDEWKTLSAEIPGAYSVVTSALESNIGLNAIAQYCATERPRLAQGLGTGQLYTNNIPAPLDTDAAGLHFNPSKKWNFNALL